MLDYRRFIDLWDYAHEADGQFDIPLPSRVVELESPVINGMADPQNPYVNGVAELPSPDLHGGLETVVEPPGGSGDSDDTP